MSTIVHKFAKQHAGVKLTTRETQSRDAITVQGRRSTIGYVNVGKELWGQLMVDRFNLHEELIETLRTIRDRQPDPNYIWDLADKAIAKAEGAS